jgi:hypothetical protein
VHLSQQTPRAGEADAEDRKPFLRDFAEGFARLREQRLVAAKRSGDGRAIAIRIERDRNPVSEVLRD